MKVLPKATIFFALHSALTAFGSDRILSHDGDFFYEGGIEALCKDYETMIRLENKRIIEKNSGKKSKILSNDDISSIFRVMGLAERIGNERLTKEIEKCRS